MKRTIWASPVVALVVTLGCPHGGPKPPAPASDAVSQMPNEQTPTGNELISSLKLADIPYIDDETYAADPSLLIGKVAEIRRDGDTCSTTMPQGRTFFLDEKVTGLKLTAATKPELDQSVVVNKQTAGSVGFLSYLSAQLGDSSVFSLIVTDQSVRRADDSDPSYKQAKEAWESANKTLLTDQNVCWLLQVDGMVYKTIARRLYRQLAGNGTVGAFGVKVDGKFFTSSDEYVLDHRFGLSFSIIKRPAADKNLLSSRAPTPAERQMLATITSIPESTNK